MTSEQFICVRVRRGTEVPASQIEALCTSFLNNAEHRDLLSVLVQDASSSLPPGWIVVDVDPSVRMVVPGWDTVLRSILQRSPVVIGYRKDGTAPFAARENIPGKGWGSPSTAGILHFEGDTGCLERYAPNADGIMELESLPYVQIVGDA